MTLIALVKHDYHAITFTSGEAFRWSPSEQTVYYSQKELRHSYGQWTLLHELGHSILGHTTYNSDIELIKMEAEAWEKAKQLSAKYDVTISEDHIQDCLDTYRDWLYQRSLCPSCTTTGPQLDSRTYTCSNCEQTWHVSNARFCRPYRKKATQKSAVSQ